MTSSGRHGEDPHIFELLDSPIERERKRYTNTKEKKKKRNSMALVFALGSDNNLIVQVKICIN